MADNPEPTYFRKSESTDSSYKRALWDAAFGLQAVDDLEPSPYARRLAEENASGRISLDQVGKDLNAYYKQERSLSGEQTRAEEADKVSHHIVEVLEDGSFALDPHMLNTIHAHLFRGIDDALYLPGEFKAEQLVKCERILNGDSVLYGPPSLYARSLDMLFMREIDHAYAGYADGAALSWADAETLARFVANVWMVHPFREGNTRTVAVFLALYLRSMGFDVASEPFARHASFFRDALVRATYQNRPIGVALDTSHLALFLSKLVEEPSVPLDYEALWCVPLFEQPNRVRNVSLADARPVQEQLMREGVTQRLIRGDSADAEKRTCDG
ncbi:MAG: Fic family protein [Atopobiaceae bacterium]|nr:Fic family protein [Atopobiaceae bacterium]